MCSQPGEPPPNFTVCYSQLLLTAQNNQENDSIISVDLNEVVVSTPFKESVKNNVLNVGKLNLNNLNYIKRLNFSNAIQEIPGVSIISTGPGISKPVIRGLSSAALLFLINL